MAPPKKVKLDLQRIGTSGLPVWHGKVYDEALPELMGDRGRMILREMSEQDAIVGGVLLGIEMLARQVPWSIIPASMKKEKAKAEDEDADDAKSAAEGQPSPSDSDLSKTKGPERKPGEPAPFPTPPQMMLPPEPEEEDPEDKKAQEVADFVDECLTDMNPTFGNTLSEILSMLIYGWSWLEIIYKRRNGINIDDELKSSRFEDGKIGWGGWSIRSQETLDEWEFSDGDQGRVTAMHQWAPPRYERKRIPRAKSLHFTTRSRRENPEGISILRNAYRAWYMKKNIEAIEGIGIERDLAGLPVMWAPEELFSLTASDEEKALLTKLQGIVTAIKRDEQEGILMPMSYDDEGKNPRYKLELLSTGGERQFDTNAIINRYDERIAMSMLADFILMGHQAVGSFALSTTKTGLFSSALSAIMDVIAEEINLHAIPILVLLNGYDLKYTPSISHGKIETADLAKLGDFLKQLFDSGMNIFPNPALEKHLMSLVGLPHDPGAGKMPLPVDEEGNLIAPQLNPGQPEPEDDEEEPTEDTPPVARKRAAREQKRFTPLAVRLTKVAPKLQASMEGSEYQALLTEAMRYGKFSQLSQKYQEAIREAEAE